MTVYLTENDQVVVVHPGEHKLADNFNRFHAANPHVYETLVRLAKEWRSRRPDQPCGIGMLYETARWHLGIHSTGEPITLNNNYRAFYARKLMADYPSLDGLFKTRRQRG